MNKIDTLEAVLKEIIPDNYDVRAGMALEHDQIVIRIYDIGNTVVHSYNIDQYDIENYTTPMEFVDNVLDQLALVAGYLGIFPRYMRNFNILMDQILYSKYTYGKLY